VIYGDLRLICGDLRCSGRPGGGGRHDMPPPLSSLCWHRSASRRRADRRACRRQRSSRFSRSICSHAYRCSCLMH